MKISFAAKSVVVCITSPDGTPIMDYSTADYSLMLDVQELMATAVHLSRLAVKAQNMGQEKQSADEVIDAMLRQAFGPKATAART
jgi:hypothetical protein